MFKSYFLMAVFAMAISLSATAQDSNFHTSFMSSYGASTDKVVQLAMEFSEDQYDWRPSEGVRSVKEALMHVAGANFFFASRLGAEIPSDINPQSLEEDIKTKDEAVEVLKRSIEHASKAVANLSEEELAEEVEWFDGSQVSRLRYVLLIGDHASEHLGQLIAYARSMDVTPPWSS